MVGTKRRWAPHLHAIVPVVSLCILGALNLYSTDGYGATAYHRTQVVWMVVGGVLAALLAWTDLRLVERAAWVVYGATLVLLAAVPVFGKEVNHATRWIVVWNQVIQPSEFAKLAVILGLATQFQRRPPARRPGWRVLRVSLAIVGVPAAFIFAQPDLGTTLVIAIIAACVLFVHGLRWQTVAAGLVVVAVAGAVAWEADIIRPYQKDRVTLWLHASELDPRNPEHRRILDKNLQTEQALWAIGSGRLVGRGLGKANRTRLRHLPEMHTDFAFAVFAEEHGFVGVMALLGLYYWLVAWAAGVARRAREPFAVSLAAGFAAFVFWHVFVNVGMVSGLLPVVGLPLPLVSYGGSSVVTTLAAFGLVFNAATSRVRLAAG